MLTPTGQQRQQRFAAWWRGERARAEDARVAVRDVTPAGPITGKPALAPPLPPIVRTGDAGGVEETDGATGVRAGYRFAFEYPDALPATATARAPARRRRATT